MFILLSSPLHDQNNQKRICTNAVKRMTKTVQYLLKQRVWPQRRSNLGQAPSFLMAACLLGVTELGRVADNSYESCHIITAIVGSGKLRVLQAERAQAECFSDIGNKFQFLPTRLGHESCHNYEILSAFFHKVHI